MKIFVILVLATVVVGETEDHIFYHRAVGIPLAARIKAAEEAGDAEELKSRTWGGWYASLGKYPYTAGLVVYLTTGEISICGASLISHFRLLTAAHCWYDGETLTERFEVVLGSTDIMSGGTRICTNFVQIHEDFSWLKVENDICLITIPRVEFSDNIGIINLPHDKYLTDDLVEFGVYLTGYGTSDNNDTNYNRGLQVIHLKIVPNANCSRAYRKVFNKRWLCSNSFDGQKLGPCKGDSGAPVILELAEETIVVGIHLFGHWTGCRSGHPYGHTRVGYYIDWIKSRM